MHIITPPWKDHDYQVICNFPLSGLIPKNLRRIYKQIEVLTWLMEKTAQSIGLGPEILFAALLSKTSLRGLLY